MGFEGLNPVEWSPWALLSLTVLLLLFERIVPIGRVRSAERLAEHYRETSEKQLENNTVLTNALSELLEGTKTSGQFIEKMQREAAKERAPEVDSK